MNTDSRSVCPICGLDRISPLEWLREREGFQIRIRELQYKLGEQSAKVRELVEAVTSMIRGWPEGIMIQRRQFERVEEALAALEEK